MTTCTVRLYTYLTVVQAIVAQAVAQVQLKSVTNYF